MNKFTTEHAYLITFLNKDGLGRATLAKFFAQFESWEAIAKASEADLRNVKITGKAANKAVSLIRQAVREMPDVDQINETYSHYNISVIMPNEEFFPPMLAEIPDAPLAIFVRGNLHALTQTPAVTVVGSRAATQYGEQAALTLSTKLARAGVTVISGLAFGIDAAAHRGALDGGGTTIGVLGSGIEDENITPRDNFPLAREICTTGNGCILSEYPIGVAAAPFTFPARNRIMAAMAHATLIVESTEKSGTLITAKDALEYNRDVFAVPGSIFSDYSRGANQLIARGAKIVTSVSDILDELPAIERNLSNAQKQFAQSSGETSSVSIDNNIKTPPNLTETESKIYNQLSGEPMQINDIIQKTKLSATEISTTIAMMEIAGHIRNIGGQNYIKNL